MRNTASSHVGVGQGLVLDPRQPAPHVHSMSIPDSFLEHPDGRPHLGFHYTPEDASRNLRAYVTTLLGALHCRTAVQLADGRGMLLKYVSSYVTKMHEAATVDDLYCCDVSGYQAANSFLRSVLPLAPEMAFQLSNIKVAWSNKLTKQFRAPHPGQVDANVAYQLYLKRDISEERLSLLQWLRRYSTAGSKVKDLGSNKYLVAVKLVSPFNAVFFFYHHPGAPSASQAPASPRSCSLHRSLSWARDTAPSLATSSNVTPFTPHSGSWLWKDSHGMSILT